ncbi:MAG: hypothetical protein U0168_27090 [Nannocystaceae bacterium]
MPAARSRKPAADRRDAEQLARGKRLRYAQLPWIRRWAPQRNTGELGVFGAFIPSEQHDLYDPIRAPAGAVLARGSRRRRARGVLPVARAGAEESSSTRCRRGCAT